VDFCQYRDLPAAGSAAEGTSRRLKPAFHSMLIRS